MYNPHDPRFRRTLNQISQNFESANESAQVGLFSFKEHYLKPCLGSLEPCLAGLKSCTASVADAVEPCIEPCMPLREEEREWRRYRNSRSGRYGRMESSFDFYDDWDADIMDAEETDALLTAGNAEYDRNARVYGGTTTAGGPSQEGQPKTGRVLGYGPRNETKPVFGPKRTKKRRSIGANLPIARRSSLDGGPDPTIIPNQSFLGFDFLSRLPFKITGGGGLRYKPSAAGLQERPVGKSKSKSKSKSSGQNKNALDVDSLADETRQTPRSTDRRSRSGHGRERSSTIDTAHTSDESISSRGDIFPSDEELEDAVALPDEFDIPLDKTHSQLSGKDWTSLSSPIEESDAALEMKTSVSANANTNKSKDRGKGGGGGSGGDTGSLGTPSTARSRSSHSINLVTVIGSPDSATSTAAAVPSTCPPTQQQCHQQIEDSLHEHKSSPNPHPQQPDENTSSHHHNEQEARQDAVREYHDHDAAVGVVAAAAAATTTTTPE